MKVIDRIQKLLELSQSDNPHEAASAAERAAELMREHELSEAQVRAIDMTPPSQIVKGHTANAERAKKRIAWQGHLCNALARSMGCRMYWLGADIKLFGREDTVNTVAYTFQYLVRTLDAMAVKAWKREGLPEVSGTSKGQRTKLRNAWKHSFYTGAVAVIAQRLRPPPAPVAESNVTALVVREREEVQRAYADFSRGFGVARVGTRKGVSRRDAYASGREAGKRVNLSGGGAGLPAPKKVK